MQFPNFTMPSILSDVFKMSNSDRELFEALASTRQLESLLKLLTQHHKESSAWLNCHTSFLEKIKKIKINTVSAATWQLANQVVNVYKARIPCLRHLTEWALKKNMQFFVHAPTAIQQPRMSFKAEFGPTEYPSIEERPKVKRLLLQNVLLNLYAQFKAPAGTNITIFTEATDGLGDVMTQIKIAKKLKYANPDLNISLIISYSESLDPYRFLDNELRANFKIFCFLNDENLQDTISQNSELCKLLAETTLFLDTPNITFTHYQETVGPFLKIMNPSFIPEAMPPQLFFRIRYFHLIEYSVFSADSWLRDKSIQECFSNLAITGLDATEKGIYIDDSLRSCFLMRQEQTYEERAYGIKDLKNMQLLNV
jgi:hypothetical protein